jgi:hypothetical protein
MTLEKDVQEKAIIFKIKCLTEMLHITKESSDKKLHLPTDELLFAIHQEIDQYLFGGDGYLTYVGKLLTMKEKNDE